MCYWMSQIRYFVRSSDYMRHGVWWIHSHDRCLLINRCSWNGFLCNPCAQCAQHIVYLAFHTIALRSTSLQKTSSRWPITLEHSTSPRAVIGWDLRMRLLFTSWFEMNLLLSVSLQTGYRCSHDEIMFDDVDDVEDANSQTSRQNEVACLFPRTGQPYSYPEVGVVARRWDTRKPTRS